MIAELIETLAVFMIIILLLGCKQVLYMWEGGGHPTIIIVFYVSRSKSRIRRRLSIPAHPCL